MEKYEIMYILKANLSEEGRKASMENIHKVLTDNGAEVTNVNEMGLRELAYAMKDEPKGYYVVITVNAEATALNEFKRKTRHNPDMLRSLITKARN